MIARGYARRANVGAAATHASAPHPVDKPGDEQVSSVRPVVADTFPPRVGERFADRYELTAPLREGGGAYAFLAHDHHAGRDVELVLFMPACAHPNAWREFARVIAAASEAKITGLVLPRNVGTTAPVPPYCLGEPQTWQRLDLLRGKGQMPWKRALTLGERVAEILEKAHSATGVAHRALLPGRCVVSARDEIKVLDFGVAELTGGQDDGSPYRAPELSAGAGDARSDVYALAVILFELMIGGPCAKGPLPRLRSLVGVPQSVEDFLARASAPDLARRHPDLAAMRAHMRELLGGGSATVEPQLPAGAGAPVKSTGGAVSPAKSGAAAPPEPKASASATPEPPMFGGATAGSGAATTTAPASLSAGKPAASPASPFKPRALTPLPPRHEPARLDPLPGPPIGDVTEVLPPVAIAAPRPTGDSTEVLAPLRLPVAADRTEVLSPVMPSTTARDEPATERIQWPVPTDTTLALPDTPIEPPTARFVRGGQPSGTLPPDKPGATEAWRKSMRSSDGLPDVTLSLPQRPENKTTTQSDITYYAPRPTPMPAPTPPVQVQAQVPPPVAHEADKWPLKKLLLAANLVLVALIVIALMIRLAR